jgi:hypothetical protein
VSEVRRHERFSAYRKKKKRADFRRAVLELHFRANESRQRPEGCQKAAAVRVKKKSFKCLPLIRKGMRNRGSQKDDGIERVRTRGMAGYPGNISRVRQRDRRYHPLD